MAAEERSEAEVTALAAARTHKNGRKSEPSGPQPEIFDQIGQRLRNIYNDVLTQAVPTRFLDLLQSLETGSQEADPQTASSEDAPPHEASSREGSEKRTGRAAQGGKKDHK